MTDSKTKLIFIIDDVVESREFLKAIIEVEARKLQRPGFYLNIRFELFDSAVGAIAKMGVQKPNLIVIDDLLPGGILGRDLMKLWGHSASGDKADIGIDFSAQSIADQTKVILITGVENPSPPAIRRPEFEPIKRATGRRHKDDSFEREIHSIIKCWF